MIQKFSLHLGRCQFGSSSRPTSPWKNRPDVLKATARGCYITIITARGRTREVIRGQTPNSPKFGSRKIFMNLGELGVCPRITSGRDDRYLATAGRRFQHIGAILPGDRWSA